jgi:hypothetical protein
MKTRLALLAALGVSLTSALAMPLQADPIINTYAGSTTVVLSHTLLGALKSLGVAASRQFPADLIGATARFPIPTGQVDLASAHGEIVHTGGLYLKAGGTTVALSDFVIDTTGPSAVLTGLVSANGQVVGRLPLFDIILTRNPVIKNYGVAGQVTISDASLTLTDQAAAALNGVFAVSAFAKGIPVGSASVSALTLDPAYIR